MSEALRVLFVAPEIAPWVKAGGLGDVARALPAALVQAGVDARVLVPAYPALKAAFGEARPSGEFPAPGGALAAARVRLAADAAPPLYLLECDAYFDRPGSPYQSPESRDWADNHLRFALLARVASLAGTRGFDGWRPELVHCNDWQCGLAPAYLAREAGAHAASVMTVHNLAYQGLFAPEVLPALGLPPALEAAQTLALWNRISFLKAGLRYADGLTTVSPTYAREIQGPELGFGLEGLLRERNDVLSGILNGIDDATWDPARDPFLAARYDAAHLERKPMNARALRAELALAAREDAPLIGMIARLVEQTGVDLVIDAAPGLLRAGAQLAVLGQGEARFEQALRALAAQHPGSVAVRIGFDEALAHRIEAGADLFLMPSRFEPCGLNQIYSLRYATLPIVHRTGGLADSVRDPEEAPPDAATGFVFDVPEVDALLGALRRALAAFRDPAAWR
ncbi:MAG: glycogen synthase GlgA, partial [Burkholderiales bacterium]|nr:glycogen synthase GlgA [Burkholderiales bacterium]